MRERYQLETLSTQNESNQAQEDNSALALAWTMADAADDRKAVDIVLLHVARVSYLTDYFVIATGFSKTQVRAIADSIEDRVEQHRHQKSLRVEGRSEGSWILLDYGEAIAHVMLPTEREFYNLEAFWAHAERIEFQASERRGEQY
jgi:ribosome-associated protein